MGTDWLQLFDKGLSDKILAMNRQRLARFFEENIDVLKEKERGYQARKKAKKEPAVVSNDG
jgi:hypothetical protein